MIDEWKGDENKKGMMMTEVQYASKETMHVKSHILKKGTLPQIMH